MARLFVSGAEIDAGASAAAQNTGPDGLKSGSGAITRDTSVFRSGAASWKFDSGASSLSILVNGPTTTFVDGRTYFYRAYVRAAAAPSIAGPILILGGGGNDPVCRFRTDGAIELLVAGAAQGSPSVTLITDSAWHRIEISGTATATGNWTAAELQLDGTSVATWSGTQARINGLVWGWVGGGGSPGANKVINVDDVALNDSTGASNNTWCGDGAVVLLLPTADSAVGTGWTNDAASGSNIFNAVDNTPPAGIADTTGGSGLHQIRNATSNANSNYDATMTTYTAAGVGSSDTLNAVQPVCATGAPVTTSAKQGTVGVVSNPAIANVALDATGTSGAFWAGATAGTYGAGWKWTRATMTEAPSVTKGTAPVMRLTQVTSSTRIAMCCFMGIYVDYTPAVVAAARSKQNVVMAPYIPA